MKNVVIIGNCPICQRQMWKDVFVDRHHFYPKCLGGRDTEWTHMVCHRKLHATFTEKELGKHYYTPELIRTHPEIVKFIEWISTKDPDFYTKNVKHNRKRRK